jgi:hypothetical protein
VGGALPAPTTGQRLRAVVRDNYLWLSIHFGVMGLVALGLALSWSELGMLGFAAFTAPVAVLALALRQGASKARGAMRDAASANALIRDYERLLAEVEASSEDVAEFFVLPAHHIRVSPFVFSCEGTSPPATAEVPGQTAIRETATPGKPGRAKPRVYRPSRNREGHDGRATEGCGAPGPDAGRLRTSSDEAQPPAGGCETGDAPLNDRR